MCSSECVDIWRIPVAKAASWLDIDAEAKAWGANGIRYPGSPRRKRCLLAVGVLETFVAQLTQ